MKDIIYEIKVTTCKELIVRIMDLAVINNNPVKLRNAMRVIYNRATKCMEVGGDTIEKLL